MMYRRAMQLVPDIESRVPELREMKKSYRRRRRASSGGSTSEPEGNAETKEQRVGAEEEEKQETIIEAEEESTQNAPAGVTAPIFLVCQLARTMDETEDILRVCDVTQPSELILSARFEPHPPN